MEAIIRLDSIIEAKRTELSEYAKRSDASDIYISKQNAMLAEIAAARNAIPPLTYPEMWLYLEAEYSRLARIDPNLGGMSIDWRTRPSGLLAKIPLDLY